MAISGFGTKGNLKDWAEYAKNNSYKPDRASVKASLGTEGCDQDIASGMPDLAAPEARRGQGLCAYRQGEGEEHLYDQRWWH